MTQGAEPTHFWETEFLLDEAIRRERERCATLAEGFPGGEAIARKIITADEGKGMRVTMTTIEHSEQRYPTVGDWSFAPNGNLRIAVSRMSDPRYETLVAVHELVEAVLCKQAGISEETVTGFDIGYEDARQPGDVREPGDDPRAPYHRQHLSATQVERMLAYYLGVDWLSYSAEVESK